MDSETDFHWMLPRQDFEERMTEKKKKVDPYFNPALANLIEMSYWLIKFEGDFNKIYEEATGGKLAKFLDVFPNRLFGQSSRTLLKFTRYFLKLFSSFEKLLKVTAL